MSRIPPAGPDSALEPTHYYRLQGPFLEIQSRTGQSQIDPIRTGQIRIGGLLSVACCGEDAKYTLAAWQGWEGKTARTVCCSQVWLGPGGSSASRIWNSGRDTDRDEAVVAL